MRYVVSVLLFFDVLNNLYRIFFKQSPLTHCLRTPRIPTMTMRATNRWKALPARHWRVRTRRVVEVVSLITHACCFRIRDYLSLMLYLTLGKDESSLESILSAMSITHDQSPPSPAHSSSTINESSSCSLSLPPLALPRRINVEFPYVLMQEGEVRKALGLGEFVR